ncbi:MAG: acyltransferase [Acidobacteriota bacterium]
MKKEWIEYLRALSCLAVVVIHVTAPYYAQYGKVSTSDWWLANLLNSSSRFAVPMFVMISGCLLLGRPVGTFEFYRKRASRLLPPFVFWSVVYVAYASLYEPSFVASFAYGMKLTLLSGQAYYHLWYLSMYILLMLFFPFLNGYLLGIKPSQSEFIAMFAVFALLMLMSQADSLLGAVKNVHLGWYAVFPWYFAYLFMGYVLDRHAASLRLGNLGVMASIAGLIAVGVCLNWIVADRFAAFGDHYVLINNGILVLLITLAIFTFFKNNAHRFSRNRLVSLVADASFGIYLIHPLLVSLMRKIPGYYENGAFYMPLSILVVFCGSCVVIALLRNFKIFRALC